MHVGGQGEAGGGPWEGKFGKDRVGGTIVDEDVLLTEKKEGTWLLLCDEIQTISDDILKVRSI